jgi:hypothetical protein
VVRWFEECVIVVDCCKCVLVKCVVGQELYTFSTTLCDVAPISRASKRLARTKYGKLST